jgi:hypothetical protein
MPAAVGEHPFHHVYSGAIVGISPAFAGAALRHKAAILRINNLVFIVIYTFFNMSI